MTELLTKVSYGRVHGRFILAHAKNDDPDAAADDVKPAAGSVTFTPVVEAVQFPTSTPPVTVVPRPVTCLLDPQGYVIDDDGKRGVWLVATNDPDAFPMLWGYKVKLDIAGIKTPRIFTISVPVGGEVDLASAAPAPAPAVVSSVLAADIAAAAGHAAAAAASAAEAEAIVLGDADAFYARVYGLPPSNGTNDSAAINAVIALAAASPGSVVRGIPGETYRLGAATNQDKGSIYLAGGLTYDFTGCTIRMNDNAIGYPVQALGQKLAVLAPPNLAAAPSASGGTLAAGTYHYCVTAVTALGETMAAPWVTATTTGTTGSVGLSWSAPAVPSGGPAVTGYRIYGRTSASVALVGTASGTTFTDTGSATTPAALPTGNATITRTMGKITVKGGTWDANQANRPCDYNWPTSGKYAGHCFDLQKLADLDIDVTVKGARKWAVAVADWTGHISSRLVFDTYSDGMHVVGPGGTWTVESCRGTVGDDMLGVSLAEWPNYAVSAGSIDKVTIRNVHGVNVPSFLRVLGGAGFNLKTLDVDGVSGTYRGTFKAGVYVQDDQPSPGFPNGTDVDSIRFANITATCTGEGTSSLTRLAGRNIKTVLVENVLSSDPNHFASLLVRNGDYGTTMTVESLTVRNVVRTAVGSTNQYAVRVQDSPVIKRLTVEDCANVPGAAGSNGSTSVLYVTGGAQLGLVAVERPRLAGTAGSGVIAWFDGTLTCPLVVVRDPDLQSGYQIVRLGASGQTASNVARVLVSGGAVRAGTGAVAVWQAAPVDIDLTDLDVSGVTAGGIVTVNTGVQATIRGGRIYNPGNKTAITGTPASLRLLSAELRIGLEVTYLTKAVGDQAWNSNAALSSGAGPVISNGSNWKHLYSGATY